MTIDFNVGKPVEETVRSAMVSDCDAVYGMPWSHLLREAFANLQMSGLRAVLAFSGVAVGCSLIVALKSIGHNLEVEAMRIFQGMGTDLIVVNLQLHSDAHFGPAYNVETLDAMLKSAVSGIRAAAPLMPNSLDARMDGHPLSITLVGTNTELADLLDLDLAEGRFLSLFDTRSRHVVIGANVAAQWRQAGASAVVGDKITLGGYLFHVIGVLNHHGENPLLPLVVDDAILTSVDGMRPIVASPRISSVLVRTASGDMTSRIAGQLEQWLKYELPHHKIVVQIPQLVIEGMARQSRLFSWLLAGVGGIALLGGGMGIMNVLVMSVTERRREIGVRMALGARPTDIARLFLVESVLLAMTGAVAGAAVGVIAAWIFFYVAGWSVFALSWSAVLLGMGSAVLIGVSSGLAPALSASRLTPTQALRDD